MPISQPTTRGRKASPAFQFYAADFAEGTDDLTLAEVGAYIRLLCSQWAKGGVPGDNVKRLAGIMRCAPATARSMWHILREKFARGDDGLWRNARLEVERSKQERYRQLQAERGRESAARRNQALTEPITKPENSVQPSRQPEVNPKPQGNSLSLSSSLKIQKPSDPTTSSPSEVRTSAPLVVSPLRFEKLKETHAFIGSRLRIPFALHDEFRAKVGDEEALQAWYRVTNDEIETQRLKYGDVFEFMRPRFKEWASQQSSSDDLERFRPKGA